MAFAVVAYLLLVKKAALGPELPSHPFALSPAHLLQMSLRIPEGTGGLMLGCPELSGDRDALGPFHDRCPASG